MAHYHDFLTIIIHSCGKTKRRSRNHCHQLPLTAGLSISTGDRILVIDADLQDPPELLPDMMRFMDEGTDVVMLNELRDKERPG